MCLVPAKAQGICSRTPTFLAVPAEGVEVRREVDMEEPVGEWRGAETPEGFFGIVRWTGERI